MKHWKEAIIPLWVLSLVLTFPAPSYCDSLKEIETEIERLEREVEKIQESLESLTATITSPEASRLIVYLDIPSDTPAPGHLKIYLNDRLEHETSGKDMKKENNLLVPFDSYFLPGSYEIKVTASFDGKIIEGKTGEPVPLSPGDTIKILIRKTERAGRGTLTVKSFN